MSGQCVKL